MQRRTLITSALAIAVPQAARALYDPQPHPLLAQAVGAWVGTLTYRDWSRPDQMVTLPCRLSVALTAPEELALFYVFDDGPGKTVYSYERMRFDFQARTLEWVSGIAKPGHSQHSLTSAVAGTEDSRITFERAVDGRTDRHVLSIGPRALALSKTEHPPSGEPTLRNAYAFRRAEA